MKKILMTLLMGISAIAFSSASFAVEPGVVKGEPNWKGGTANIRIQVWPKSLNNSITNGAIIGMIGSHTGISMHAVDYNTLDPVPFLASKWKVHDDKRSFTFFLDKDATWADGKPITAEDVKFTFDLIYDRKRCVLCEPIRSILGDLEKVEKVGSHEVKITMKDVHFRMLIRLGGIEILPKHMYSKGNFEKDYNKVMYGGGPYVHDAKASKFRKKLVLKRRKGYWANKYPYFAERFNFDKIVFHHIKDDTVAFEKFKRKELDFYYFRSRDYKLLDNQASAPFTDKQFKLVVADKYNPGSWRGIGLNMRKGVLADKKVRKAMQHMLNRDLMISKIYRDKVTKIGGPFMRGYKYSSGQPSGDFDLAKAGKLLKEAGFTEAGPDGYLQRTVTVDGKEVKQKASVSIIYAAEKHSQWLTVYKEDAKKAGFEIIPRFIEWSKMQKLTDDFRFDAMVIGWGGAPVPAPEYHFLGEHAVKKGSSNYSGLQNKRLDELMKAGPREFDEKKRIGLYHEMEKIILDEQPYVFQWTNGKHYAAYWKDKIDPTDKPFLKYSGDILMSPFFYHWRIKK